MASPGTARHGMARPSKTRQGFSTEERKVKIATATLKSVSPYSQSKHFVVDKEPKESSADFEKRTWRERVNVNEEGEAVIPPMAFKNCLSEIAKYLGMQIPGKGKSTYTKHIEAGIMVVDPLLLGVKKYDVKGEWFYVPSDGVRGSGKRVDKCFPVFASWSGKVDFLVMDETVTKDVFLHHLQQAGNFIGVGRFRPRKNGYYGRFKVEKLEWKDG
jgi:hypothetical protein